MAITGKITDVTRALKVLEGFLYGIAADQIIDVLEIGRLKEWLENHKNLNYIYPFCETYDVVTRIIADGEIDGDEQVELLEYCRNFFTEDGVIDKMASEMRTLHGILSGIIADNKINTKEMDWLKRWMLYHDSNSCNWPFDEIYKKIDHILKDGVITREEQDDLINFCRQFDEIKSPTQKRDETLFDNKWMESGAPILKTLDVIVDRKIPIEIPGRYFCFTGQMRNGKRREVMAMAEEKGAICSKGLLVATDYLVIGALSNPCWMYSTYGRKIEKVMNENMKAVIIHEDDFMRSLQSV